MRVPAQTPSRGVPGDAADRRDGARREARARVDRRAARRARVGQDDARGERGARDRGAKHRARIDSPRRGVRRRERRAGRDQGARDAHREREDEGEVFTADRGAVSGEVRVAAVEAHGQRASSEDASGGGAGAVETAEAMRGTAGARAESAGADV